MAIKSKKTKQIIRATSDAVIETICTDSDAISLALLKPNNMKKSILIIITVFLSLPYFVGVLQYQNACIVIANLTDQTDGEIEDVLATFDFNIDCMTTPNTIDYYKSGIKAIDQLNY